MFALSRLAPVILFVCSIAAAAQVPPQAPPAQAPAQLGPAPDSIKDPKQLLAAIAPSYDFANPAMKPWHFKAGYQIFDPSGNPGDRGTIEYWWASPGVFRTSWTRGSSAFSQWHTADGTKFETASGPPLHLFEQGLIEKLLDPLPQPDEVDPKKNWLERDMISFGNTKAPCVRIRDRLMHAGPSTSVIGTWCFDPKVPVLVLKSTDTRTSNYSDFVRIQDHSLARSFLERIDQRRLVSVTIDTIGGLAPGDPALTPPATATAKPASPIAVASHDVGPRLRSAPPEYPTEARSAQLTGTVLIEATVDRNGKVKDLEVVSTPGKSLSDYAIRTVSNWEFKPHLVDGNPVEKRIDVEVSYRIGY